VSITAFGRPVVPLVGDAFAARAARRRVDERRAGERELAGRVGARPDPGHRRARVHRAERDLRPQQPVR
jgi:hypothetical protein